MHHQRISTMFYCPHLVQKTCEGIIARLDQRKLLSLSHFKGDKENLQVGNTRRFSYPCIYVLKKSLSLSVAFTLSISLYFSLSFLHSLIRVLRFVLFLFLPVLFHSVSFYLIFSPLTFFSLFYSLCWYVAFVVSVCLSESSSTRMCYSICECAFVCVLGSNE